MAELKPKESSQIFASLKACFDLPFKPGLMLLATIAAFLLAHSNRLDLGPNGYHKWRESDTAMVADNFASHHLDFFYPQVNLVGHAGDGVVGMELPIYNYMIALAYRLFGFTHMWPRLLSVLSGLFCIAGFWLMGGLFLHDKRISGILAWVCAWSPLVYFYSYKIQPDILGLALSIWAVSFFTVWLKKQKIVFAILSGLCLCVAGGIKPTFLSVGLPMLWIYRQQFDTWQIWKKPELIVYGLLVLVVPAAWMMHAKSLTASFGESYFYLGEDPLGELGGLFKPAFFQNVLLTWPIELALGIPSFIAALFAILTRKARHQIPILALFWVLGGALVLILAAEHCATPHDYYYLVIVPPFFLTAAIGYSEMLQSSRWRYLAMALLVIMPVFAILRMEGRFSPSVDVQELRGKIARINGQRIDLNSSSRHLAQFGGELTLAIDNVPGFLLYVTGLRGFHMQPDGDISYFHGYRSRGAQWVVTKKSILSSISWLEPSVERQILEDGDIILLELKKP